MDDNRARIARQTAWLGRSSNLPLRAPFGPRRPAAPGPRIDLLRSPHEIEQRALGFDPSTRSADCMLMQLGVNLGPAFLPALAGAGYAHDEDTSWSLPCAQSASDFRIPRFDPSHPLLTAYEERLIPLLAHWSWEGYLPGMADVLGPMDVLAGCLGPETLSMALIEEPEAVRDRSLEAAQFIIDYLDWELGLQRSAGLSEGCTECFSLWMPGRGVRLSEDFSALVGPEHVEQFFVEPDSLVCESVDTAILHTHSSAWRGMPAFLRIRNLSAIEFGNDPNGPDMSTRLAVAQQIQAAGKALVFGSWEIPLPEAQIHQAEHGLDPAGLLLRFQAHDEADYARLASDRR